MSKIENISLSEEIFYKKKAVINIHHFLNLVTQTPKKFPYGPLGMS